MSQPDQGFNHFIGTIGFSYRDWMRVFYPAGLSPSQYLTYYSRYYNAVEIDTTFYGSPRIDVVRKWEAETPAHFRICVKTPKMITHEHALVGVQSAMEDFVQAMLHLGDRLGPILIQLPPSFTTEKLGDLETFIGHLPGAVRYAIELRSQSWYTHAAGSTGSQLFSLLEKARIAWVGIDYPGLPTKIRQTTDFLYIRWIGQHGSYQHHDHERELRSENLLDWVDEIKSHSRKVQSMYGFFNNDYTGYAAGSARRFKQMSGYAHEEPAKPIQGTLF